MPIIPWFDVIQYIFDVHVIQYIFDVIQYIFDVHVTQYIFDVTQYIFDVTQYYLM